MLNKKRTPRASAIALNGDLWFWSCGWHRARGNQRAPLSHSQFHGSVQLLNHTKPESHTVLLGIDRPCREWRRMTADTDFMLHPLYGEVKVMATDGCHCVIRARSFEGTKTCCFENLSEMPKMERAKVKREDEPKSVKRGKRVKVKKAVDLAEKYLNL